MRELQCRAVLLILLLAGADCRRIAMAASVNKVEISNVHSRSNAQRDTGLGFATESLTGGGNDVCRMPELGDPVEAVKRYQYKVQKVTELSAKIRKSGCMLSCIGSLKELRDRVRNFDSCIATLEGKVKPSDESAKEALKDTMTSNESDESLSAVLSKVKTDMAVWMKGQNLFKTTDKCGFFPENLDIDKGYASINPDAAVRQQLFGKTCGSLDAVAYTAGLGIAERKALKMMIEAIPDLTDLKHNMAHSGLSRSEMQAAMTAAIDKIYDAADSDVSNDSKDYEGSEDSSMSSLLERTSGLVEGMDSEAQEDELGFIFVLAIIIAIFWLIVGFGSYLDMVVNKI